VTLPSPFGPLVLLTVSFAPMQNTLDEMIKGAHGAAVLLLLQLLGLGCGVADGSACGGSVCSA
jgi:hypothetical protein